MTIKEWIRRSSDFQYRKSETYQISNLTVVLSSSEMVWAKKAAAGNSQKRKIQIDGNNYTKGSYLQ